MIKKPLLAIDLDDTLATTTESLVAHMLTTRGVVMDLGDISSAEYWGAYGFSDEEAIAAVHGYELAAYPGLGVVDGAPQTISNLARKYDLMILTARDPIVKNITQSWVNQHFPGLFTHVVFVGNPHVSQNFRSKAEVCAEYGVSVVVDDSPFHIASCVKLGLRSLLFGGYPWHERILSDSTLELASDWSEVERRLL